MLYAHTETHFRDVRSIPFGDVFFPISVDQGHPKYSNVEQLEKTRFGVIRQREDPILHEDQDIVS